MGKHEHPNEAGKSLSRHHGPGAEYDCVVIGGGPAGLTAAIYLARFHLSVMIIDAGESRALWIACTHNHPGYPGGISGKDLLERMHAQCREYGVRFKNARASHLGTHEPGFEIGAADIQLVAKTVLLATGVKNRRPEVDAALHIRAVDRGFIRYCPVCDGFEVSDKKIAVIGTGENGISEACFLRSYSSKITLIAPKAGHMLEDIQYTKAQEFGIDLVDGPAQILAIERDQIWIETPGSRSGFDTIYPALGTDASSELARQMGANISSDGCVTVDSHQRTSIEGLYAAGDVVLGLDQISHAMGEGAVAATTMRNDMAERSPMMR